MRLKNIIWFSLLIILLVGCQLLSSSNVETVVTDSNISYWRLSPNGEYLVYGDSTSEGNFLLNLATGQKHQFNCRLHWWDSKRFGCYNSPKLSVIDVETLIETTLIEIDLTKELTLDISHKKIERLLAETDLIYRPEWVTDTVYILAEDYQLNPNQNYVIGGLTNPDELLKQYTVITVPRDQPADQLDEQVSPNGLYYYTTYLGDSPTLTILSVDAAEIVAEFSVEDPQRLEVRGWAVDSSGVYFHPYRFGGFFGRQNSPQEILKLKVPDE